MAPWILYTDGAFIPRIPAFFAVNAFCSSKSDTLATVFKGSEVYGMEDVSSFENLRFRFMQEKSCC